MLISDSIYILMLALLIRRCYVCLKLAKNGMVGMRDGLASIASKRHFFDHVFAVSVCFVASAFALAIKVANSAHQFSGNIMGDTIWWEISLNAMYAMIAFSLVMLINHIIKEEDPTHEFYFAHNGESQ